MGNSGKWFRIFFTRKRDKVKQQSSGNQNSSPSYPESPTTPISIPPTPPKDRKRWSFRRSSATAPTSKDLCSIEPTVSVTTLDKVDEQKKHAMEIAAATAAAADAAMAAAEAAAAVIRLTASANERAFAIEEAAATKIQSAFRSYLARKALCALRGLVKLQALVRGHLVRKQATATLHCMQALIAAQVRARALRIQTVDEAKLENHRPPSAYRRSTHDRVMHTYNDMETGLEENIKIVEIDSGSKNRNNHSNQDYQVSPSLSRTLSGHFEDYGFSTAQSSPQRYSVVSKLDSAGLPFDFHPPEWDEPLSCDDSLYPNYMANTQSSRAKARSQSAPKQRPADPFERQASRRRPSVEGRNVPRAVRMQRSSSHLGATAQNYQYPWSMKLDRSTVSLIESECGSTSTVLTNNYCRSVVTSDPQGYRY